MKRWPSPTVPTCCSRVNPQGGFGRGAGCRPDGAQGLSGTAFRTAAQSDARQTPQGTTRERSRRESVRGEIDRTRLLSGNARRIGLAESARLLPTTVRTRTGIRNRFPPAASAPPGKPGKSETKSGKDCGLATDSGSASRKNKQTTIFEHRFASYSSRESFRIRKMESETTTF